MIQRHFAGGLLCLLAWLPIAYAQAPRADVQARAPSPADVDVLNRHNWRLISAVPNPIVVAIAFVAKSADGQAEHG